MESLMTFIGYVAVIVLCICGLTGIIIFIVVGGDHIEITKRGKKE